MSAEQITQVLFAAAVLVNSVGFWFYAVVSVLTTGNSMFQRRGHEEPRRVLGMER